MRQLFDSLVKNYLDHFQKEGESSLPFLIDGKVSSEVFLLAYKKLPPIEQMPEKEKKEMKLFVIDLFPEKTEEEKVISCKILYTIGSLL